MDRNGKIASLNPNVLGQLNVRLKDGARGRPLAEWLNSLPEVQALMAADFEGNPITQQNVSEWKRGGHRDWLTYQKVRHIVQSSSPDDADLKQLLTGPLADKLSQWLTLRFAAAAHSLTALDEPDPKAELHLLGELSADLLALRRSQLSADRVAIEQQRLSLEKSRTDQEMEKQFWEWTKRPDIVQKLHPHRDPEKIRREVDRLISRRLLGIRDPGDLPDEYADPAMLI